MYQFQFTKAIALIALLSTVCVADADADVAAEALVARSSNTTANSTEAAAGGNSTTLAAVNNNSTTFLEVVGNTTIFAGANQNFTANATANVANANDTRCVQYKLTATYGVIGGNASYRGPWVGQSKNPTLADKKMLDGAVVNLTTMINDATLNDLCGNLSALALTEAMANRTRGIFGEFSNVNFTAGIQAGIEVPILVTTICLTFFGVFWFAK